MSNLADRIAVVRERIERAASRAGRPKGAIRVVAVSKTYPSEAVREAYALGLRAFGENYAQELSQKAADVGPLPGLEWHMIGHLQTNKAKMVAPLVSMLHTVDSSYLAVELGKRAAKLARQIDVLIEVNVAKDPNKSGCSPVDLAEIIDSVHAAPALSLRGLMTMPPHTDDPELARPYFAGLRALQTLHGGSQALPELSMGMSHDLEAAILEGATIVRVGTAIFGERTG